MTNPRAAVAVGTVSAAENQTRRETAACACRLYDAECALHAARMSGVAAWVEAASEKLHLAVANYLSSLGGPPDRIGR